MIDSKKKKGFQIADIKGHLNASTSRLNISYDGIKKVD